MTLNAHKAQRRIFSSKWTFSEAPGLMTSKTKTPKRERTLWKGEVSWSEINCAEEMLLRKIHYLSVTDA